MKHFKKPDGSLWAMESDGSQDHRITPDMVSITEQELRELLAPPLTAAQAEEIKRHLLAEALVKRDILLGHLRWFYTKATEDVAAAVGQPAVNAAKAKRDAIQIAIDSLQNVFTDPRVVAAVDGEVKPVLATIKNEIGLALAQASPSTYYALLALDPI